MKTAAAVTMAVLLVISAAACTPAPAATQAPTVAAATDAPTPVPTAEPTVQPTESGPKDYSQIGADLMESESLGEVKLGMTESELLTKAGQPDGESETLVWGADGMKHSDWTYNSLGLTVNMTETTNPESEYIVFSITASASCTLPTAKGVKVGDSRDAVLQAYGDAIEDQSGSGAEYTLIAGSPFGGVIFQMKDDAVASIFIGAGAE